MIAPYGREKLLCDVMYLVITHKHSGLSLLCFISWDSVRFLLSHNDYAIDLHILKASLLTCETVARWLRTGVFVLVIWYWWIILVVYLSHIQYIFFQIRTFSTPTMSRSRHQQKNLTLYDKAKKISVRSNSPKTDDVRFNWNTTF